ncbi:hypothetical protein CC85DRAFT_289140 [Cutaneotrichosporon oleaginosum]|uniref:Oxysterol-binding protein n=1 Tax=Cutaneotrichosporon oleaginosum TaxID=879819 RepID=A0A0J1AU65_9TREE|nr:uncharacterized protein CC85DRAFT_289140 [Cutaneotrichosporon oleaginosum]KLT38849.1 hypothetical protein CC85DRAFT_289140 [Cutaneotrichosporon oleaginosum]TXT03980.1 hypothetical protein COLE_07677 [Cutaneotrichosporon oleaginosum]
MGLLSQGMDALNIGSKPKSRRTSLQGTPIDDQAPEGSEADTSTLDKDEGNILMALISQLRPGMDLTKIALPTFVLEPRSLLERITDFFSHPDLIFGAGQDPDARVRFMRIMTFYLSGWHIKPRGVKKPYNPILNEFYRCTYYYPDGSQGYYVAEQVSHHPPISAFFYVSPKNGILVTGELKPKSRFLGNSAATIMEGEDRIRFLNRPDDGEYCISMPNTYARGILFGKMLLELGDLSTIRNDVTGYNCDVDFKTKGWVSGGYNLISGKVTGPGGKLEGEINGMWSGTIDFNPKGGKKSTLFDASKSKAVAKAVLPESMQEENESRRLWAKLTDAIKAADMNAAQAAKSAVEDRQRELRQQRAERGEPAPTPRFFVPVGDKFMPKLDVDKLPKDVDELEAVVRNFIFGDRVPGPPPAGSAPPTSTPALSVEVPPVSSSTGSASAQAATPQTQRTTQTPASTEVPARTQAAVGPPGVAAAGAAAGGRGAAPVTNAAPSQTTTRPSAAPRQNSVHMADEQHPVPAAPKGVDALAAVTNAHPGKDGQGEDPRRASIASTISDDEFHDAHEDFHPPHA